MRFRGERKRNPHPVPLPRRGGIRDGKVEGNEVKIFFFTHTPLLLATFKGGV